MMQATNTSRAADAHDGAARAKQVPNAIEGLEQNISDLEQIAKDLRQRLDGVITPRPETPHLKDSEFTGPTVARSIAQSASRVYSVTAQIREMLDSLEI